MNFTSRTVLSLVIATLALLGGCAVKSSSGGNDTPLRGNVAVNTAQAKTDTDAAFDLIRQGKLDDAKRLLLGALAADPMYGPAHNDLGLVHFAQGRDYEAAWSFERAAKLMPKQGEPQNNIGLVYERAGRYADAEAAYRTALDLDSHNIEFIANLARVRVRQGLFDESTTKLLNEIASRDHRPEWVDWARSNLNRGVGQP